MKDGSYQIVSSYQVTDGRVRYYSVERSEWEEIPAALVDWDATRKAEAEDAQQEKALVGKIKAEEAAAKAATVAVDASLEVLPGVFLPPGEGVFVLDNRAIFPLSQSEAVTKLSKRRLAEQVLVPLPVIPSRRNIELQGAHASFRISSSEPEFYVRTAEGRQPQIELLRAKIHGNQRQIGSIDTLFTEQKEKGHTLPLQAWEMAKDVYRYTLSAPLAPGEYAIAEVDPKQDMDFFVWDFGVNPRAGKTSAKRK